MIFSHAFFASALINTMHKKDKDKYSVIQNNLVYFVAIVGSIFPDLDLILTFFNSSIQHRYLITHSILPYLLLLVISILFARLSKNKTFEIAAYAFFIGCASHIFLDFFAGGLVLFAPLSFQIFGFPIYFDVNSDRWGSTYLTSKYMYFEILFFIMYLIAIYKNENKILMWLPLFFLAISLTMFLLVI